jgi:hypothetical protein
MLNLSLEETSILLSVVKASSLDLRLHRINDLTLQTILNNPQLADSEQFKINGANFISH